MPDLTSTAPKRSGLTIALSVLAAIVSMAVVGAMFSGTHWLLMAILCLLAAVLSVFAVRSLAANPSSTPTIVIGTLAVFAAFAIFAALLQSYGGGAPAARPNMAERVQKKEDVAKEQS